MSLSVNDLYNSLGSTSTLSSAALKSTASADQLTSQIKDAGTDDEMMSACENFEAYLLQKMFENMEKSAKLFSDDDKEGNEYTDMFGDPDVSVDGRDDGFQRPGTWHRTDAV